VLALAHEGIYSLFELIENDVVARLVLTTHPRQVVETPVFQSKKSKSKTSQPLWPPIVIEHGMKDMSVEMQVPLCITKDGVELRHYWVVSIVAPHKPLVVKMDFF
jgi:hypothetical protein